MNTTKRILFGFALIMALTTTATSYAESDEVTDAYDVMDTIEALPYMSPINCFRKTSLLETVCKINRGIALTVIENAINGAFPPTPVTLDSASNTTCSTVNPCFGNVLDTPVTSSQWTRISNTQWKYQASATSKPITYTYDPVSGDFSK